MNRKKNYQTHTVTQVEELLYDYADRIRDAKTKSERKELLKFIRGYEKQFNNVNDKKINGKVYPVKEVPPKITKVEMDTLIDSVQSTEITETDRRRYEEAIQKYKNTYDETVWDWLRYRFEY